MAGMGLILRQLLSSQIAGRWELFFHHLEANLDLILWNGHGSSCVRLPEVGRRTKGQFERAIAICRVCRNRIAQILSGTRTDEVTSLVERGAGVAVSALDADAADAGAGFCPVEDRFAGRPLVCNHLPPRDFTEVACAARTDKSNGRGFLI